MQIDPRVHQYVTRHSFPLLFATISGAHLYGFPSADSDFDLRGVHILPLRSILGLNAQQETVEYSTVESGLEIDLVTHDVKKFFGLLLKNNGYVLEQLLSPLVLHSTPEYEELKEIANQCLTRNHAYHYLGFAETQWRLFMRDNPPRVKPLLYIYRVLLTGIFLMRSRKLEANLETLNELLPLPYLREMIEIKRNGAEKGFFNDANLAFHEMEYIRLRKILEDARIESDLPNQPTAAPALNDLLVRIRLKYADMS